jgi:hypothetical protein
VSVVWLVLVALAVLAAVLYGVGWALGRHAIGWRRRAVPQAGDNPVQTGSTDDGVVTLADVVALLEAGGSTVAGEFLPPAERVDRRTLAAGVLVVPGNVDVDLSAHHPIPLVIRSNRPEAVRLEYGLAREAARVRRAAYHQLLRGRAARGNVRGPAVPEPTVGPAGPSGVSSAYRPPTAPPRGGSGQARAR